MTQPRTPKTMPWRAPSRRRGRARSTVLAWLIATAGVAMGCGESAPPAKAPTSAAPPAVRVTATAKPGQTVGVSVGGVASGSELTGEAKAAYDRGFQAWMSGDLSGAKSGFTIASAKAPGAGGPKYSLGCVLERLGDSQGALDAYKAAFGANSKYEVAMGAYALLLASTGHGQEAEQLLSDKLAQTPDSPALLTYKAEVKSVEGDSPGCQQLAQQALAKQPDFKDAMVVIARDYYRNHRWDLAKYALGAILEGADDGSIPPRDKGNAEALLLRGLIDRELGQRKQAIVDFDQAVQKRPDLFEAYVNLGEMKLEAGNASEAQDPLERAARYAPNVPVVHLDLGDCYRLLGRPGDSKSELDKALGMDSTLAGVHYDLGLLYLFSPGVPGASGQDDQLTKAIHELETYKSMRGAKTAKGQGDDVDELLSTAKRKQSELQLKRQAAAPPDAAGTPPAPPGAMSPPEAVAAPSAPAPETQARPPTAAGARAAAASPKKPVSVKPAPQTPGAKPAKPAKPGN